MKEYKKRITVFLVILSLAAVSGCDFISKETPVNVQSIASQPSIETSDNANSASDTNTKQNTETEKETDKNTSDKNRKESDEDKNKVTGLTLDVTELTLEVGQSALPKVTVEPSDAENKNEIWESSDKNIADVNSNGVIEAFSPGKCVVTVTSEDNPSVSAAVNVTVKEIEKTKVSEISVSFTEATLKVGESVMPVVTMSPSNADTLQEEWTSNNETVATVDKYGNITAHSEGSCTVTVTSVSNKSVKKNIKIIVESNETANQGIKPIVTDATYINGILVVNKSYGLPSDYNPGGLTWECAEAFEALRQGAAEDGINIYLSSGFRSYETQNQLYNSYVNLYGKETADTFSARPGHSEHQTGLAIDCNIVNDSFIGTPEAVWLEEHCYEYGFIIRYPQGKESITGYKYEPWHIRYLGVETAQDVYYSGLTLEEYLGIDSVYSY